MAEANNKLERRKVYQRSEAVPTFYANNVEMRSTQWDFRFSLGQMVDVNDEEIIIKTLADVYMSPQHAKAFATLIVDQIAKWEARVGAIQTEVKKD